MSTSVIGFIPNDDPTYIKHCKVLDACLEANIEYLPKETAEYFGEKHPVSYLKEEKLAVEIPMEIFKRDSEQGFEVIISDLPEGVHKIRFVNSY